MQYFSIPRWKQPRNVNGILERYILYISNHTHDFTIWDVIYNSTELFQDHLLQYLSPGNKYLIKLGVSSLYSVTFSSLLLLLLSSFVPSSLSPSLKKKTKPKTHVLLLRLKTLTSQCKWESDMIPTYLFCITQNDGITI